MLAALHHDNIVMHITKIVRNDSAFTCDVSSESAVEIKLCGLACGLVGGACWMVVQLR